jgi:hypothetical protein
MAAGPSKSGVARWSARFQAQDPSQHFGAKCSRNGRAPEDVRLTETGPLSNVKYMSRFIFAAAASIAFSRAAAAQVPGRDLLEFPLGTLAEAPALSRQMAAGLWNPAASVLARGAQMRLGLAALTTPYEVGVNGKLLGGVFRVKDRITGAVSFTRVDVGDIFATENDPQSLGDAIRYGTSILSLGASTTRGASSYGIAARYRWGTTDTVTSGALSVDFGFIVDRLLSTPVRLAASTFLLTPGNSESSTLLFAADVPFPIRDSTWTVRGGISLEATEGRGNEAYLFTTAHFRQFDARVGLAQSQAFGNINRRVRFGAGFAIGRYSVAISREDGAVGLGAQYQFLLTSVFR